MTAKLSWWITLITIAWATYAKTVTAASSLDSNMTLTNLLHSVELAPSSDYKIINELMDTKLQFDVYTIYQHHKQLGRAITDIRGSGGLHRLPEQIKIAIQTETGHLLKMSGKEIRKIDNAIAYFWKEKFQQYQQISSDTENINSTIIPKIYDNLYTVDTALYKIPNYYVTLLKTIKTDKIQRIVSQMSIDNLNHYSLFTQIEIKKSFQNRYAALQNICAIEKANLDPELGILFPPLENVEKIKSNLIRSLGLSRGKYQENCLFALAAYYQLLEGDLNRIVNGTLVTYKEDLTFLVGKESDLQLVVPMRSLISEQEYNIKLITCEYPAIRYRKSRSQPRGKRNVFLDLIGAASEADRLENALRIRDIDDIENKLKNSQSKIQGEVKKLLGDRIAEGSMLTSIGDHVNRLEKMSSSIIKEANNATEMALKNQETLVSFMALQTALNLIKTEINMLCSGLHVELTQAKQVWQNLAIFPTDTSKLITATTSPNTKLTFSDQGIIIETTMGLNAVTWRSVQIKTIPVPSNHGHVQLQFDSQIITDGFKKILPEDLHKCNHASHLCPGEIAVVALSQCEKFFLQQSSFQPLKNNKINRIGDNNTLYDCTDKLKYVNPPKITYVQSKAGLILNLDNEEKGYRICPNYANSLTLVKGLNNVGLEPGCKLKIGQAVFQNAKSHYPYTFANYSYIEDRVKESVEKLVQLQRSQNYTGLSFAMTELHTNLSTQIYGYLQKINESNPPIPIELNTNSNYLNHAEMVSHFGPLVLWSLLAILFILAFCCCKCVQLKFKREIKKYVNKPSHDILPVHYHPAGGVAMTSTPMGQRKVFYPSNRFANSTTYEEFKDTSYYSPPATTLQPGKVEKHTNTDVILVPVKDDGRRKSYSFQEEHPMEVKLY